MRRLRNVRGSYVLAGVALLGALPVSGCGDEQKSGTVVEDTPEAQAGRKASMEGMKNIMDKQKPQPKQ